MPLAPSADAQSRIWFTISHGILNEVYAPRLDMACIRDCGLIVTAKDYFSEEKRDADHTVELIEDGVPAFRLVNTSRDGRYRITKSVLSDPDREVVLQDIRFEALIGKQSDYQVHASWRPISSTRAPGIRPGAATSRDARCCLRKGAVRRSRLHPRCPGSPDRSVMSGPLTGGRRLSRGEGLKPEFQRAENGNVALAGTLDLAEADGRALLALGFGTQPEEAAFRVVLSLQQGAGSALKRYSAGWKELQGAVLPLDEPRDPRQLNRYRVSTAVLATHRDDASGAIIASLSIPWGFAKGDNDLGGYHLVWPRDLVETAGGLLAAGASASAKSVLDYLMAVQEADGHWVQNSWLDGRPYWQWRPDGRNRVSDPALRHAAARRRDRGRPRPDITSG